jgi:hypothetical protein
VTSIYDKLNLRPNERRLVTGVIIVVFILLNFFFVWPHFGDWKRLQSRKRQATDLLKAYQTEVDQIPRYQKQLAELQQAGAAVASEDQASKFSITVNNQAALSGVQVNNSTFGSPRGQSATAKPNQFFDEQRGTISVVTDEKSLVDFLYNLGVGGSMIRVRDMSLNTDGPRQKLMGTITLIASYARKTPPKAAPAATAAAPPRTNAPATMAANLRSTNTAARSNMATTRTTNAAPGFMQRLKNWTGMGGKPGAPPTNAPAKK